MLNKINKLPVILSIAFAICLFACGSGNQPPTLKIIQAEHTSSVTKDSTVPESLETTDVEEKAVTKSLENTIINDDDRPRNTEWADADGNPRYAFRDVYGKQHTENYFRIHEKPLFNGGVVQGGWYKYVSENGKFNEIAEKNNIQEGSVHYALIINTDGTAEAIIFEDTHQALGDELLRVINATKGKWTPGKHNGELMKARIHGISFSVPYTNETR